MTLSRRPYHNPIYVRDLKIFFYLTGSNFSDFKVSDNMRGDPYFEDVPSGPETLVTVWPGTEYLKEDPYEVVLSYHQADFANTIRGKDMVYGTDLVSLDEVDDEDLSPRYSYKYTIRVPPLNRWWFALNPLDVDELYHDARNARWAPGVFTGRRELFWEFSLTRNGGAAQLGYVYIQNRRKNLWRVLSWALLSGLSLLVSAAEPGITTWLTDRLPVLKLLH
jgi:hypothetical protein